MKIAEIVGYPEYLFNDEDLNKMFEDVNSLEIVLSLELDIKYTI